MSRRFWLGSTRPGVKESLPLRRAAGLVQYGSRMSSLRDSRRCSRNLNDRNATWGLVKVAVGARYGMKEGQRAKQ